MEKQTKRTYILFGLALISVILHNAIYGIFKVEEPIFFILFFFFTLGFFISAVCSAISYIKKGEPKDLWKLGWFGFLGLLGLIPGFNAGFYGFLGFLGFFGAKKRRGFKK